MQSVYKFFFIIFSLILWSSCDPGHDNHSDHEEDDEEHFHANSGIELGQETAKKFGVEFEIIKPSTFRQVIKTSGIIETATTDISTVTAKKNGIITLADGILNGVSVRSGEKIATISSQDLEGGDPSKAIASNLATAKAEYERLKPLYEEKLITTSAFREAERIYNELKAQAGKNISGGQTNEYASISGTIVSLQVNSGQYVEVGMPIAIISKNTNLTLKVDVPVRYAPKLPEIVSANIIPEGSDSIIRLSDHEGKKIEGGLATTVAGFVPLMFTFTGSPLINPGGFAEVYLLGIEKTDVISIPRSSLLELQGNKYLYIVNEDDKYEKRLVKTGADNGERIEILDGVVEGEKIVSNGASIVRMAEISAIAPPAHNHNH